MCVLARIHLASFTSPLKSFKCQVRMVLKMCHHILCVSLRETICVEAISICVESISICVEYSWLCKLYLAAEVVQMPGQDGAEDVLERGRGEVGEPELRVVPHVAWSHVVAAAARLKTSKG